MASIPPALPVVSAHAAVACVRPDSSPILPKFTHITAGIRAARPGPGAREPRHSREPVSAHAQQFLDAQPVIAAVIRDLGRRYHLSRDEQDDFSGVVTERLIEQDYAVLRRFEGRSSLSTYLRTVITRLFLDQRVKAWGRWRPSADAVRLGPTAVALERLLERQRLGLEEAIETLRARDATLDDEHLRALAARLPRRVTGRRLVDDAVLSTLPASGLAPDEQLAAADAAHLATTIAAALRDIMATVPARDRLLLRMRYEQGMTVANISRALREEQKPLYRHLDRLLAGLRRALEDRGVSAAQVQEVAGLPLDASDDPPENDEQRDVSSNRRPDGPGPVTG